MALTGTGNDLGDKIAAIITAANAPPEKRNQIKQIWEAIGTVLVDHFISNVVVKDGIPLEASGSAGSVSGSTTGPGSIL